MEIEPSAIKGEALPYWQQVDRTTSEHPTVWLVWDDGDYYGPHLQTVYASRDEALAWIDRAVKRKGYSEKDRRQFYIEGLAFGDEPS